MSLLVHDPYPVITRSRLTDILHRSQPYRERFGWLVGMRLMLQIREGAHARGDAVRVTVPGLSHPIFLRAWTSDRSVFEQIFLRGDLDFPIEGEPRVIIDAGAYTGLSSVYLANRFPNAKIIALEIDGQNFELLRRNTAPYPSIVPRRIGLWSKRTWLKIVNPHAESWSFQAAETVAEPGAIEAVGVADLVAEFGSVDILKMDIEGGEVEVFSGAAETWLDDVDVLAVELHDRFRAGCREALNSAVSGSAREESIHGEFVILKRQQVVAAAVFPECVADHAAANAQA